MTDFKRFIGTRFEAPRAYEVGREKIREFAAAVQDHSPVYLDPEAARAAGYPDVIAPVTFLAGFGMTTLMEFLASGQIPIDIGQIMHTDQKQIQYRPLVAGDVLTCALEVESIREMGGSRTFVIRADFHSAQELVQSMVVTVLGKATAVEGTTETAEVHA